MTVATLRQMFAMDGVVTAANSSIAIAAAVLISTDARAVVVLIVPAAIVFGVYRAYVSERQRHEKLEFLYEANRALTRSPEVAEAIEGVLARSLEAFRSEVAEVVLFSADGTPLRTTYGPGDERVTMVEGDAGGGGGARRADRRRAPGRLAHPAVRPGAAAGLPGGARHPARHGRDAAGREPHDRHDHAREPVRDRARLRRGGSAAARGAGQQRQRRAPVRPPRAGRHQAACAPGAAAPSGLPRFADRAAQPLAVHVARGDRAGRQRGDARRAVHRRRRLQGRQRLARARRRRRAAGLRGRPPASLRAAAGHRRAARRGRVRGHAPGRRGSDGRAARRRVARAARLRGAGQRGGRARGRPPQRRRRRQPPHARSGRADPRGRSRDVSGEDVGQGPVRVLRSADGGRDAAPPRPQGGSRQGGASAARSSSSTSRSSSSPPGASRPPRRSCAGSIPCAGGCPRRSSSPWPRRTA